MRFPTDWMRDWYSEHPTRLFLVILGALLIWGMAGYLKAAYGTIQLDTRWRGKIVEAANYATQTVTTVGYGNIDPPENVSHPKAKQRIRAFSAGYALVAPFLWVLLVQRLFGRASYN